MPTKTWSCRYEQHEIRVENYWNFLLWWRERLFLDGKLADENQGWGFLKSEQKSAGTLHGRIKGTDHRTHEIKVLLGQAKMGFTIDCKIWVDSELVFPESL